MKTKINSKNYQFCDEFNVMILSLVTLYTVYIAINSKMNKMKTCHWVGNVTI